MKEGCAVASGASPQPQGIEAIDTEGSAPSRVWLAPGSQDGHWPRRLAGLTPRRWVYMGPRWTGREAPQVNHGWNVTVTSPVSIPSFPNR